MSTHADTRMDRRVEPARYVPAYRPIESLLGYALFYVVVSRATEPIVAVASDVLPGVAATSVRTALAFALWFVLVVMVIDQLRRQLAAMGLANHDEVDPDPATRTPPSEPVALGYLVGFVFAGGIAWLTFERGITALLSLIPVVATLDGSALSVATLVVAAVFFVSYGIATMCLDRLLIGGLRWLIVD